MQSPIIRNGHIRPAAKFLVKLLTDQMAVEIQKPHFVIITVVLSQIGNFLEKLKNRPNQT